MDKKLDKALEKLFEKGKEFILSIKPWEKISVFYHRDLDGVTSSILTKLLLDSIGVDVVKTVPLKAGDEKSLSRGIKKCDKAIVLDVPLKKLPRWKILYIDHHPMKDFNSKNIVHINPTFKFPGVYQPVCYLVYKLFSEIIDMKKYEWIAVLGTVADYGYDDCRDLLDRWMKVKNKDDIWETIFGRVAIKINGSLYCLKKDELMEIISSAENIQELDRNKKINSAWKRYEKIYRRAKKEFYKNRVEVKKANLVLSTISGNNNVYTGSSLSNELSRKYPDKVIVVIERTGDFYRAHARQQSGRVHMGKLMEACSRGIGWGGGHRQAASAAVRIRKDRLGLFKKRLIEKLTGFSGSIR
jgi:single-stranded DNA-specific DHH superfamily exonuclease